MSELLKLLEIFFDWNSYRNMLDVCILIKKNEEYCVFIFFVYVEFGLMLFKVKIVMMIIEYV